MRRIDLIGRRFGQLVVVAPAARRGNTLQWLVKCDCGATSVVAGGNLRNGHTTSCGCARAVASTKHVHKATAALVKHGEAGRMTAEYSCWRAIRARCLDPNNYKWHLYGGRGVTICERWRHDYSAFLSDMGRKPSPLHTIDRIDTNGNYEPSNCRWATSQEQTGNTRRVRLVRLPTGETMPLKRATIALGLPYDAVYHRVRAGMDAQQALDISLSRPVRLFRRPRVR